MKTAEEIYYDQFGRKPTWDELFVIKEYAKQLLEEYTHRIAEHAEIHVEFYDELTSEPIYQINRNSITSQLPKFLKEKGI
jgi:hypothetical protein